MGRWQVDEAVMRLCRPRSMSAYDPKATFARFQSRWSPNTDSEDGWSQIERVPAPSLLIIVEREMAESPTT